MIELAEAPADFRGAQHLRQRDAPAAFHDVGRRLEHELAEHVRDDFEPLGVRVEPIRILARELRDFLFRAPRADGEIPPVLRRQEVRDFALDDLQAVRVQIEIADDLRIQQRDGVRSDGVAKARMEFLGDGRTADDVASLQHGHLQAGRREIRSADQAVVAAADDQDITACRHRELSSGRGA